jgi:hypothetical protein
MTVLNLLILVPTDKRRRKSWKKKFMTVMKFSAVLTPNRKCIYAQNCSFSSKSMSLKKFLLNYRVLQAVINAQ